jgi:hypothetical protein
MIVQLDEMELQDVDGGVLEDPRWWDRIKDWFSGDGKPRPDPSPTSTNV